MDEYDFVIVGGGPAGSSTAIHLRQLLGDSPKILLLEQKNFPRQKLCGEFISPECLGHFAKLNVTESIKQAGSSPLVQTNFYSAKGRRLLIPSAWFGVSSGVALGLSRAAMDKVLLDQARKIGVDVRENTQATGLILTNGKVVGIEARDAAQRSETVKLGSRLCIDASGRARVLARRVSRSGYSAAQSERERRPRLIAFKAHLSAVQIEDEDCEIYFYRGGYGGVSRIEGGLFNHCFIVDRRMARGANADASQLMQKVVMQNARASEALSQARVETPWIAVAIDSFGRRDLSPAEGLLTVGDAASFIDPFTGSGMLMALESGEIIAGTIARYAVSNTKEINHRGLAAEYRSVYGRRFNRRLRFCSFLRRAAFAPPWATELITAGLSLGGDGVCRYLARTTRDRSD